MEVIVKNNQISKTHISKMAYNNINNILACNIDGNDTILFFALDSQLMTFLQLFKGMSKPPGSKISMSWSPDGKYLALAAGNVEMWEFKEGRIKPVKSFQEDFIEIKIIEWSVDSQCYACGGISRTNTIKIRNIETGKVRQLQLPQRQTISAISFDPYGKYLFLLLRNNSLEIYSVVNYQKYKSVRLSPQGLKINPIKQIRMPSWSPDFSNFVCPSLDDSRINLAINLARAKDFKTKNIFMGHCTSISCCKFNPKLYKWNGEITSIVAMGDSAGNVSFWRIGNKNDYPEPLLLSNSLQNSMQVVEDLDWDDKGEILMVNMMKKYVHLIRFVDKTKTFGIELSNDQMFGLIRQTYGSNRATDVNKRQIQVFEFNSSDWGQIQQEKKVNQSLSIVQQKKTFPNELNEQNGNPQINKVALQQISHQPHQNAMQIEEQMMAEKMIEEKPKIGLLLSQTAPIESLPMNSLTLVQPMIGESKNEYVKLSQQKIMIGKNNKKRIQPAMMVRKDQMRTMGLNQPLRSQFQMGAGGQNSMNTMYFSNSMVQTFPSLQLPMISFSQKQISTGKNRILQIKKLNKVTSLQMFDLIQDQEYLARRIFPSTVDYIHVSEKFIYVINQQHLYIFDLQLNPKQLPLKVGYVHKFLADQNGTVYLINCQGYLIGFDHVRNTNKTLTPVPLHLLLNQNFQTQTNPPSTLKIKQFVLTINSNVFITIESENSNSKHKRQRFLYDPSKNGWSKLEFKQGLLEPGFSIRISDSQQNIVKNFFSSLCPSLKDKIYNRQNGNPTKKTAVQSGVVSQQEQEMIFYQKYQKDTNKFYDCLIEYLNSLKKEHKNKQFRSLIHQYFFDSKSLNFIGNNDQRQMVWQRVLKSVGGNIIQEFLLNTQDKAGIEIE